MRLRQKLINMKIALASKSNIKLETIKQAVTLLYPSTQIEIIPHDVEDKGSEPMGEEALLSQLSNAIKNIKSITNNVDFYIAMEGGVREVKDGMEEIAYVMIEDGENRRSISQAVTFPIPPAVAEKIRSGIPFATAVDDIFLTTDIKNNQGFIGLLTNSVVDKKAMYFQPTVVALSRYLKEEWFWK
jgi:non-canonical (house-cleaning) NTP pyrophosphatase